MSADGLFFSTAQQPVGKAAARHRYAHAVELGWLRRIERAQMASHAHRKNLRKVAGSCQEAKRFRSQAVQRTKGDIYIYMVLIVVEECMNQGKEMLTLQTSPKV